MRYIIAGMFAIMVASSAHAQTTIRAGFGTLIPMIDLEEVPGVDVTQKIGLGGSAGIEVGLQPSLSIFVEGSYNRHTVEIGDNVISVDADASSLAGNIGILAKSSENPSVYGFLAPGYAQSKVEVDVLGFNESETENGVNLLIGAGIRYLLNTNAGVFLEARYTHTFHDEAYRSIPIHAGLFFTTN